MESKDQSKNQAIGRTSMNYLSVCSGIEAATVAWHDLGWKPAGFSEIENFPSQVLAHHYPNVTNFGDMTKYKEWKLDDTIGLLVGGTPCQSFSVAGLRKGLEDPRGNLALTYVGILDKFRPKWCIWENVPGVLSSGEGRDFGSFLGALAELGYGFAYRVLDAQYFGVAQRRRRVFVVGHLGDWKPAAEVLFESESLSGDFEKGKRKKQNIARNVTQSIVYENHPSDSRVKEMGNVCQTVTSNWGTGGGNIPFVQNITQFVDTYNGTIQGNIAATMTADMAGPTHSGPKVMQNMAVRRLTPIECERLQGFPDNYTNIPKATDSPRYKALGNSMAVPVMRWIGERINQQT
jgi:DNA (cytosine-5)-methyltransferase 1